MFVFYIVGDTQNFDIQNETPGELATSLQRVFVLGNRRQQACERDRESLCVLGGSSETSYRSVAEDDVI